MSCSAMSNMPKSKPVSVNGVVIPRDRISEEIQNHPADTPLAAWHKAATALAVRELLIQEANHRAIVATPITDNDGRRETDEEAKIRALIERDVEVPEPDDDACRRYYDNNRVRFRSADLYEVRHILLAAAPGDRDARSRARALAENLIGAIEENPERFEDLAREHSACPSATAGGNLGQIGPGQTVEPFERALRAMAADAFSRTPVETQYGFHIIHLVRKFDGKDLPFDLVRERISDYLATAVRHRALAQYISLLVGKAVIDGIDLSGSTNPLVQ